MQRNPAMITGKKILGIGSLILLFLTFCSDEKTPQGITNPGNDPVTAANHFRFDKVKYSSMNVMTGETVDKSASLTDTLRNPLADQVIDYRFGFENDTLTYYMYSPGDTVYYYMRCPVMKLDDEGEYIHKPGVLSPGSELFSRLTTFSISGSELVMKHNLYAPSGSSLETTFLEFSCRLVGEFPPANWPEKSVDVSEVYPEIYEEGF